MSEANKTVVFVNAKLLVAAYDRFSILKGNCASSVFDLYLEGMVFVGDVIGHIWFVLFHIYIILQNL